jgi:antirestriction protein ArdC
MPYNPITGNQYSGENIGALISQAAERGYQSMQFAGFRQWLSAGRAVKKGEKAVYAKMIMTKKNKAGKETKFPAGVALFAIEQTQPIQE